MHQPLWLLPCLRCGHPAEEHSPVEHGSYVTDDGARMLDLRLGGCTHVDEDTLLECPCSDWDPDTLPHVTELLGLDVRQVTAF